MNNILQTVDDIMQTHGGSILSYYTMLVRFLLPLLAILIIYRCARSLLRERSEAEEWGYLSLPNGTRIFLNHWENIIGRARSSDAYMEYPILSRSHAAIIRDDKGDWRVYDIGSMTGVRVNGGDVAASGTPVKTGDIVSLGGVELVFVSVDKHTEYEQSKNRTRPGRIIRQGMTLTLLTEFQLLLGMQVCVSKWDSLTAATPLCFVMLIALTWVCYVVTRTMRRVAFEVETIAFFLCTIGLAVTASSVPGDMVKQMAFMLAGVFLFFAVGWFLRDLDRVARLKRYIAGGGLVLLGANLLLARTIFGARNWLQIGGISFQPSEFVKIAFIFAGAATLDRLFAKRNLMFFIAFAGACVMALAAMSDFGTALIFFVAFLIIAFLRSGDLATVFLSIAGAGYAGFLALTMKPHVAARFATWGHAWEAANAGGYQQVRAMSASASGGLFGVGAGNGWLKGVFAADTDLVFGMVSEELGLIVALCAVLAILALAVFTVRASGGARSSFYVIASCAAVTILVFQMMLNLLGSVDILPFTGVTFPFVSKGGSSLIACWALLAFIKAADTRAGASFAIKMPKRPKAARFEYDPEDFEDYEYPEDEWFEED